jgi:hypothetical protein
MYALITRSGTAMHEAGLCGKHVLVTELKELAIANAQAADDDWNGNRHFTDVTGNDSVYCPACGDETILQRLEGG